jgi:fatty acid desaturase
VFAERVVRRVPTVPGTVLPAPELLTPALDGGAILPTGRPAPPLRAELRRIPSLRNGLTVAGVYLQTLGIIVGAIWLGRWWGWILAFLLMGRAHAQFASLMHESAHRLLFRHRGLNDWVGRWLLGYPSFTPTDQYRRIHMAHHRDEFGPDEPDLALYAGYPISRDSFRRKLWRDASGQTGWKLLKGLLRGVRSHDAATRRTARSIVAVQLGLAVLAAFAGYPLVYWLLWLLPYLTVWRVINRLRSIAEHGGMMRSSDRRQTTHTVRQHAAARFVLVPYRIGWHLAHHCDSGIPMRNLPRYHAELVRSGYVADGLEYRNYLSLWRALASGAPADSR